MKTTYGPQFTATRREHELIRKIVRRAVRLAQDEGIDYDVLSASMDIEACHCNGMPLDLARLADADDGTFGHDVFGIRRFINRQTGEIGGCFVPRTALPDRA
jgi:hypothetical protein